MAKLHLLMLNITHAFQLETPVPVTVNSVMAFVFSLISQASSTFRKLNLKGRTEATRLFYKIFERSHSVWSIINSNIKSKIILHM